MPTWSHRILAPLAVLGLLTAVACGSAASPNPASAPSQSAAPKPSTAPAQSAAKPADSASTAPQAWANSNWKAGWDQTVADAKKEGKVVVQGYIGDLYREAAMAFQKAYPDIAVQYTGVAGSNAAPKTLAERSAGQYLWDVYFGGSSTALQTYRPNNVMDPLKPALVLPEVLDDSKWVGGTKSAWVDKDKQYVFAYEASLLYTFSVNRDMVPEAELNSLDQLLDPKWKGKIVARNLKLNGAQTSCASLLLKVKGEDWIRKLFAQEIVQMDDERAVVESVVRGRYPIMICVDPGIIQPFKADGLSKGLKPLDTNTDAGVGLNNGVGNAVLFNKAPHPNAAKVFINWLLSVDGQKAWVTSTNEISRRTDVTGGDPELRGAPNRTYLEYGNEDMLAFKKNVQDIAKEMFK